MSAFKSIALSFFKSALSKTITQSKRKRKPITIADAQRILVIYDGREQAQASDFEAFASLHTNKEVRCFRLMPHDQTSENSYSLKQTNFSEKPKPEVLTRCNSISTDLLILFNPQDLPSLHFLAVAHDAPMKVSTRSSFDIDADLVFDRKGDDLAGFLADLAQFMKKISV
jgi:hypothetical protein